MAKLCGAEVAIVGLEADRARIAIAQGYGCDGIIGDATTWAQARDGMGADVIIDAAGASVTLGLSMKLVRPNGKVTKVGWGPQPLNISLDPLVQKNITLQEVSVITGQCGKECWLYLPAKQLDVRPIIGGVWSITEWHTAFEKMHKGEVVKSVLKPV